MHAYPNYPIRILFGLSKNKDMQGCLKIIAQYGSSFHIVEASNGRGLRTNDIYHHLKKLSISPHLIFTHPSIFAATREAKEQAFQNKELLLICGSFFIMHQVRQALGIQEPYDIMDLNERFSPLNPK